MYNGPNNSPFIIPNSGVKQRSCTQSGDTTRSKDSLLITSWNIDGLTFCGESKMESTGFIEQTQNRDIIFLCETHARQENIESNIPVGFTGFGADGIKIRGINKGRLSNGMLFLVKSSLTKVTKLEHKSDFALVLKLQPTSQTRESLYIIGCYVPPENSKYYDRNIWEDLKVLISRNQALGKVLVIGDFNARTNTMQASHLATLPRTNLDMEKTDMGCNC